MNRADGPPNEFEAGKPGTAARNQAEAAIEALRRAGGVFVDAVRATRMPMVLTDPTLPGNPIVFANESFLKLSGYRMQEVLGQQPHFLNGRLTDPQDAARFAEAIRSDQDDIIETVQYRKDGSRFVATVLISAFKDDEGRVANHFMSYLDVTRRVEAEGEVQDLKELNAALHQSEARFRSVFDTMIEACCFFEMIYDDAGRPVDWRILEANPGYEKQSGLKDVAGKLASEVMPGTEDYWIEAFDRVAQSGQAEQIEKWHQPTGRWIHSSTARVGGPGSKHLVSVFYDVTERKRAEAALRESEEQLQAAFQSVPVGVAVIDLDGIALTANAEYRRFLPTGVIPSRDHEKTDRWRAWDEDGKPINPEDWPSARALRGEAVIPGLHMLFTADDGREIWTRVASAPTRDRGGTVTGAVSTITDVDAAKRSADALQESEERLRLIVESARDYAIFTTDLDNRIDNWLPGAQNVFGWSKEEAEGQPVEMTFTPEDRATGESRKEIETARREGKAPDIRWHQHKDGRRVFIDGQMIALRDASGTIDGFLKIGQDTTEKHRASEMQATLLAELQHRVRNTLGILRSIARRTAQNSSSVEEMDSHLQGRIAAFSRVQAIVTRAPGSSVPLQAIIEDELVAHAEHESGRIRLKGPEVSFSAKTAESLSLAVHELATNSVKYGALSGDGQLHVRWSVKKGHFHFDWRERLTGKKLETPTREGFGTELLLRGLPFDLHAETSLAFHADGVEFNLSMPMPDDG